MTEGLGRLSGKVALITGAGSGIGEATTVLFAKEGAKVGMVGRRKDALEAVGARIAADRGEALALPADVSDESAVKRAVASVVDHWGGLDILVTNAGTTGQAGLEVMTMADWARVLDVNLTGTLLCMRAAIPAMRRRGGGAIVNISSLYGLVAAEASPAYHASKGGLRILSKAAALEYATQGIRVNAVYPGLVDTPMLDGVTPERLALRLERTPMARKASPIEIAYAVLFLASDEASFITGAELVVDGGYTVW